MEGNFLTSLVGLGGVPVVLALTQLVKPWIKDARFFPFVAVFFGLIINILVPWALGPMAKIDWLTAILIGILAGLAAGGLYDTSQTKMNK